MQDFQVQKAEYIRIKPVLLSKAVFTKAMPKRLDYRTITYLPEAGHWVFALGLVFATVNVAIHPVLELNPGGQYTEKQGNDEKKVESKYIEVKVGNWTFQKRDYYCRQEK